MPSTSDPIPEAAASTAEPQACREGSSVHPFTPLALTSLTMTAFAANSLLCRMGLGKGAIDAASYTTVRLVSGAVTLMAIASVMGKGSAIKREGSWLSAVILFVYAITFSYAYISLGVGAGALILFGAVQVTMILAGLRAGERPRLPEWVGLASALSGLVYLVLPGLTAPSPVGSVLMATAGVAWGVYSLRGRGTPDPVAATAANFVRSAPLAVVGSLAALAVHGASHVTARGALMAALSGAIASGCGYVVWYAALRYLTAARAAMVQLSVPVLASLGGVLFLSEKVSERLVYSSVLVLGGIALALTSRQKARR